MLRSPCPTFLVLRKLLVSAAERDGQGLQRQAARNAALADERADLAIDGGGLAVRVHRTLTYIPCAL